MQAYTLRAYMDVNVGYEDVFRGLLQLPDYRRALLVHAPGRQYHRAA